MGYKAFALRNADQQSNVFGMWNTGSGWLADLPAAEDLLDCDGIDALATRHPESAHIIDVVVHRAILATFREGWRSVISSESHSSLGDTIAAREAGYDALERAGYARNALAFPRAA